MRRQTPQLGLGHAFAALGEDPALITRRSLPPSHIATPTRRAASTPPVRTRPPVRAEVFGSALENTPRRPERFRVRDTALLSCVTIY